jgi:hypothetical protein
MIMRLPIKLKVTAGSAASADSGVRNVALRIIGRPRSNTESDGLCAIRFVLMTRRYIKFGRDGAEAVPPGLEDELEPLSFT